VTPPRYGFGETRPATLAFNRGGSTDADWDGPQGGLSGNDVEQIRDMIVHDIRQAQQGQDKQHIVVLLHLGTRDTCHFMTPIQQCLQSHAVLAKTDDLNGISLAESKFDEFVRTAGTESAWQIIALDDLKHEITDRGWGTTCSGHMLDYIARQGAVIAAKFESL
jgi:hypothetical protein